MSRVKGDQKISCVWIFAGRALQAEGTAIAKALKKAHTYCFERTAGV